MKPESTWSGKKIVESFFQKHFINNKEKQQHTLEHKQKNRPKTANNKHKLTKQNNYITQINVFECEQFFPVSSIGSTRLAFASSAFLLIVADADRISDIVGMRFKEHSLSL